MVDAQDLEPGAASGRCPWCSAPLADSTAATCPSCGATLVGETEQQLPGVTALDAEAILRAARAARAGSARQRSRLLSWIAGDSSVDDVGSTPPETLAPPPPEVAREMLRLELAAEVADLQAEASTVIAEAEVEAREAGWRPDVADLSAEPAAATAEAAATEAAAAAAPARAEVTGTAGAAAPAGDEVPAEAAAPASDATAAADEAPDTRR